jgi:hypothetical protein
MHRGRMISLYFPRQTGNQHRETGSQLTVSSTIQPRYIGRLARFPREAPDLPHLLLAVCRAATLGRPRCAPASMHLSRRPAARQPAQAEAGSASRMGRGGRSQRMAHCRNAGPRRRLESGRFDLSRSAISGSARHLAAKTRTRAAGRRRPSRIGVPSLTRSSCRALPGPGLASRPISSALGSSRVKGAYRST